MVKIRARIFSILLLLTQRDYLLGLSGVLEELKYILVHAQIDIKILTPFYKTTVNVSLVTQVFWTWGKMNYGQDTSVLAHALSVLSVILSKRLSLNLNQVVHETKSLAAVSQTRWNKSGVSAQFLKTRVHFTLPASARSSWWSRLIGRLEVFTDLPGVR